MCVVIRLHSESITVCREDTVLCKKIEKKIKKKGKIFYVKKLVWVIKRVTSL